jgi:hypothetical protein
MLTSASLSFIKHAIPQLSDDELAELAQQIQVEQDKRYREKPVQPDDPK